MKLVAFWGVMFVVATIAWLGVLKAGAFMPHPWRGGFIGSAGFLAARAQWECVRQGIIEWRRRGT